jgi:hypothetical protein
LLPVGYARIVAAEKNDPDDDQGANESVVLDFVCARGLPPATRGHGAATGRYMAGQLETLPLSIAWRIWLVDDPGAEVPELRGSS